MAKKLALALNKKSDKNDKELSFTGYSLILHSPTKLNYWHVELALFDENNGEITKAQNVIGKKAAGYMLTHVLCRKGKSKPQFEPTTIRPSHYQNN